MENSENKIPFERTIEEKLETLLAVFGEQEKNTPKKKIWVVCVWHIWRVNEAIIEILSHKNLAVDIVNILPDDWWIPVPIQEREVLPILITRAHIDDEDIAITEENISYKTSPKYYVPKILGKPRKSLGKFNWISKKP